MALGFLLTFGPLLGLSVMMTLVAVLWCVILMPRLQSGKDRFLVGLVGLISVHHGLRLLQQAGVVAEGSQSLHDAGSLFVTALYTLAVLMLEVYTKEYRRNRYRLRLAEGNEAPPMVPYRLQTIDIGAMKDISQAVADASPLPMFAVDPRGRVCYWNLAAERMFGYEKAEVLGRPLPQLGVSNAHGDDRRWLTRKDGSQFEADTWTAPVAVGPPKSQAVLTVVGNHTPAPVAIG